MVLTHKCVICIFSSGSDEDYSEKTQLLDDLVEWEADVVKLELEKRKDAQSKKDELETAKDVRDTAMQGEEL